MEVAMQKITPCLWFDNNAEEAMNYYVGVFKNAKINRIDYYPDESLDEHFKGMSGKVITGEFELDGVRFICLDGGPLFKFNESVSFAVDCADQAEVDYYWERLSHVPESEQCGWCKDKFGVSWQIVPKQLNEVLNGEDKEGVKRAMVAMMQMHKLDVAALEAAYAGK
jgi:predicted 3-demethylubiquinone-9 3-methyltransferase (glyoxalase superfamily)